MNIYGILELSLCYRSRPSGTLVAAAFSPHVEWPIRAVALTWPIWAGCDTGGINETAGKRDTVRHSLFPFWGIYNSNSNSNRDSLQLVWELKRWKFLEVAHLVWYMVLAAERQDRFSFTSDRIVGSVAVKTAPTETERLPGLESAETKKMCLNHFLNNFAAFRFLWKKIKYSFVFGEKSETKQN